MADNVAFQSTTLATPANTVTVDAREQASGIFRQVVTTSTVVRASANFTRPSDTTAYASGDLIANSTTAASVAALSWTAAATATTVAGATFLVRRAKVKKSGTTITNAAVRLHLYGTDPAVSTGIANGDNGAFSVNDAAYLGWFDVGAMIAHRNFSIAIVGPASGAEVSHALASGQTIYGLLEARGAYTPVSAEVFTVELEIYRL